MNLVVIKLDLNIKAIYIEPVYQTLIRYTSFVNDFVADLCSRVIKTAFASQIVT